MLYAVTIAAAFASCARAQNPWHWGANVGLEFHVHEDHGCQTSGEHAGTHKYRARLWDIPWGYSWEDACANAPHTLAGITYPSPHYCLNENWGMWGEWYIPDTKCEAEMGNQPTYTRGEDDELKREGPLTGYIDMHAHLMAHLGFGGVIFLGEPYGEADEALPDCPSGNDEGHSGGHSRVEAVLLDDIIGGVLNTHTHENGGNPTFDYWPRPNTFTHQAIYYKWLKRAYEGGLRAVIAPCVNGDFMYGKHDNGLPDIIKGIAIATDEIYDLDDMLTLHRQVDGMRQMEAWIDEQHGGPGQGWFRIVDTPEDYRQVVSDGKLAVILATEVDYPIGCTLESPCTEEQIVDGIDDLYDAGIRLVFPIHLKTNDFGGAGKFNILGSGDTYDCNNYSHDCNPLGLTNNGKFLIQKLAEKGMIIDVGHHSQRALSDTLDLAESLQYPGIVTGHTTFYDIRHTAGRTEVTIGADTVERIIDLGGMIGVIAGQGKLDWVAEYYPEDADETFVPLGCGESSQTFAQGWLYLKDILGDRVYDGRITIGTDFNGFAAMPGPRFGDNACYGGNSAIVQPESSKVQYPFTVDPALQIAATLDDGESPAFEVYTFGERTFDYNYDGAAHMGMLPDFFEDLRQQGLKRSDLEPLYRSAEFYVSMWESAIARSEELSGNASLLESFQISMIFAARRLPSHIVAIASAVLAVAALLVGISLRYRRSRKQERSESSPNFDSLAV